MALAAGLRRAVGVFLANNTGAAAALARNVLGDTGDVPTVTRLLEDLSGGEPVGSEILTPVLCWALGVSIVVVFNDTDEEHASLMDTVANRAVPCTECRKSSRGAGAEATAWTGATATTACEECCWRRLMTSSAWTAQGATWEREDGAVVVIGDGNHFRPLALPSPPRVEGHVAIARAIKKLVQTKLELSQAEAVFSLTRPSGLEAVASKLSRDHVEVVFRSVASTGRKPMNTVMTLDSTDAAQTAAAMALSLHPPESLWVGFPTL